VGGWLAVMAALAPLAVATIVTIPLGHSLNALADRVAAAAHAFWAQIGPQPAVMLQARTFAGSPAVGALFAATAGGGLATHFCTASVVDSPDRDVLVTAAHCVAGAPPGSIVFVPGFDRGRAPYGVWRVTRVIVDSGWESSADPNDDFAFLVVTGPGGAKIQNVTGGERLGRSLDLPAGQMVQVVGYPGTADAPITCENRAIGFGAFQLEFDCGGYTDGTSGSPLLQDVNPATGLGTIIGVIGGYEQGGYYAAVSYAARFGASAATLYQAALRQP
jgi:V8-like Glu-specific endopeptidase